MKVLCEPKAPRVSRNPLILVIALIFLTAVMATLLPACGGQNREASEPTVSQDPKTPPAEDPSEPAHPSEPPLDPSPLTGQPMVSPGSPVAVAIDNNPDARPQTGLTEADIVYEVPAEGGITRFLALFHSRSPEVVGPVRSSRPYFALLAKEWGAVFGHCGGDPELDRYINEWKVVDANEFGLGHLFWRDSSRRMPHNLYTSVENLRKVPTEELPAPSKRYEFKDFAEEPEAGISIRYGRSYAVLYRLAEGSYNRYVLEGSQAEPVLHVDRETEEPVSASNVILQYTSLRVIDSEGRLNIDMVGTGKAAYLLGGVYKEGTWEKSGVFEPTLFYDASGEKISLSPGQTWIHIVPQDVEVNLILPK
jgi:hypothetical protein